MHLTREEVIDILTDSMRTYATDYATGVDHPEDIASGMSVALDGASIALTKLWELERKKEA